MAGVISTGNHPKALWPGVAAFFGKSYARHPRFDQMIFEQLGSEKKYEEIVELTGLGLASVKSEGGSVSYDSESQGPTTRFTNVAYGIGAIVTREAIEDNQYTEAAMTRAEAMAFSMFTTRQIVAANVLNRAFNSSYTGGDGVELCSTAHVTASGTQSNELATAADLSEASLEDLLIQIKQAQNARGLEISLMADKLVIPPALEMVAHRLLSSTNQAGTANNDINAVRSMGLVPGGVVCNPYLTDTDAWFLTTNVPKGLICFNRRAVEFTRDNDFDTENAKMKATERYSMGWANWRGVFGSPGA